MCDISDKISSKKFSFIMLWLFVWIAVFSGSAQGAAYVLELETGNVDWYNGLATANGQGFYPADIVDEEQARAIAKRQALIKARQNLWRTLQEVRLDEDLTIKELLAENTDLKRRLQGLVHNARLLSKTRLQGKIVVVSVALDLHGEFSRQVIPDSVWFQSPGPAKAELDINEINGPSFLEMQEQQVRTAALTGLLIDARGLSVEPALLCRVQDEQGNVLYGPGVVDPEWALKKGMAAFVQDQGQQQIQADSRTGQNPLRLRATEALSEEGCVLVVDQEQINHIQHSVPGLEFLEKCRVLIVLDRILNGDLREYRLLD